MTGICPTAINSRVGDSVVPPPDVIRYEGDDPYLVVAADEGTASFSDIANAIAREYGFWLGDERSHQLLGNDKTDG